MNPEKGEFYNQIADDRDHTGMRLPNKDLVDYGYGPGKGRLCTIAAERNKFEVNSPTQRPVLQAQPGSLPLVLR
jgi:hypothetical protein